MSGNTSAGPRFASPQAFCGALSSFLELVGGAHHEEDVTQVARALQAAQLARRAGADDALVVAALLHDIGMLLLDGREEPSVDRERGALLLRHEAIGARFLARWFGADVVAPVALHVTAKRYLVATDPSYAARLSTASARSLPRRAARCRPARSSASPASRTPSGPSPSAGGTTTPRSSAPPPRPSRRSSRSSRRTSAPRTAAGPDPRRP